jgi:competence protein ComEA
MFKKLLLAVAGFLASAGLAFAAVDLNTADKAALDSVKGVGPVIAERIVAARKDGKFKDWADMVKRVNGVGDATAAEMSGSGATINGTSFKGAAPKAMDKPKADSKPAADAGKAGKPAAAAGATAAAGAAAAKSDKPSKDDMKKDAAPTKAEKAAMEKKEKAEKAAAMKKEKAEKDAAMKKEKADKEAAMKKEKAEKAKAAMEKKDAPSKEAKKDDKPKQ